MGAKQHVFYRVQTRDTHLQSLVPGSPTIMTWLFAGEADPPIPPGATKFSYSTRLGEVKVKLCDTDMDFLEVKVCVIVYTNPLTPFVIHPNDPVVYIV
jgi:hypothetical protein